MTQKEKSLLVLKALILENLKEGKQGVDDEEPRILGFDKDFLLSKIEACLELSNPQVLLGVKAQERFKNLVEDLRKRGKII